MSAASRAKKERGGKRNGKAAKRGNACRPCAPVGHGARARASAAPSAPRARAAIRFLTAAEEGEGNGWGRKLARG